MSSITFKIDGRSRKNIDHLIRVFGKERLFTEFVKFFGKESLKAAGFISSTMLSGQRLNRRTGALARSITGTGLRVDGIPAMRVGIFRGPALKYAGVQNEGTKKFNPNSPYQTIKPKRGKALAIPLDPVLTPAGVDRYGGPRGFPGELHFIPFRRSGVTIGALFDDRQYEIAREFGLQEAKAAYLLMTEVDIKPTFYLRDGFRNYFPLLARNMKVFLQDMIANER